MSRLSAVGRMAIGRGSWVVALAMGMALVTALGACGLLVAQESAESGKGAKVGAAPAAAADAGGRAPKDGSTAGPKDGSTAGPTAGSTSPDVHVGIYASQIHSVNLKENKFTIDFYIWFRWTNPELRPHKTMEVANGKIDLNEGTDEPELLPDGTLYAYRRIVADITQFWDVTRFPLDDQTLEVAIDDSANEEDKLRYIADAKNTGIDLRAQVPGWKIEGVSGTVGSKTFSTNFGDTRLQTGNASSYSRFTFAVECKRRGIGQFLKLFFGLFVATGIAFLAFFIKPTEVDPRFGLGVGAIFAAVASEYVVTSSLPDSDRLAMADMLHILAFIAIFASLIESTWSLYVYSSEDEDKMALSRRVDRRTFWVLGTAYVALSLFSVAKTWWL